MVLFNPGIQGERQGKGQQFQLEKKRISAMGGGLQIGASIAFLSQGVQPSSDGGSSPAQFPGDSGEGDQGGGPFTTSSDWHSASSMWAGG